MGGQPWWAGGVDVTKPSPARVYDAQLGGNHNFEVDRRVAEEANAIMPSLPAVLQSNRSLLRRMVQYLARTGVTQFLDLGSGIPTVGNVHEIAQEQNPRCRVVYVDYDLIAVTHSRTLLRDNDRALTICADLRDPAGVLNHPDVVRLLDFSRPVALLLLAVLHFVSDAERPVDITAEYVRALAPGSYLAISHACDDDIDWSVRSAAELYSTRIGGFWMRSEHDIGELFAGLPLIPPGLVDVNEWRPDSEEPLLGSRRLPGMAGIGQKPRPS